MGSTPLEITIELATPVAYPSERAAPGVFPLMLDSLLIHLAAMRYHGAEYRVDDRLVDIAIPLDRADIPLDDGERFRPYCASGGVLLGPRRARPDFLTRKWSADLEGFVRVDQFRNGSGALREYLVQFQAVAIGAMRFWAVGDPEGVADLLGDLSHVGNLGRVGYGRVSQIRIRKVDHDYSLIGPGHSVTRPVPVSAANWLIRERQADISRCGYDFVRCTPPYWLPEPESRSLALLPPVAWWYPTEHIGPEDQWLLQMPAF